MFFFFPYFFIILHEIFVSISFLIDLFFVEFFCFCFVCNFSDESLLALSYEFRDRLSPFYEEFDHQISLNVGRSLDLSLNVPTLARLMSFAESAFASNSKKKSDPIPAEQTAPTTTENAASYDETIEQLAQSKLRVLVEVSLKRTSLLMHEEQVAIAELSVRELQVCYYFFVLFF